MMSNEQFERMMNRLDTLIKITAINAFQDKSRTDVVRILSSLGFSNKDIATILGTTAANVATVKYQFRRKQKKKKKLAKTANTEKGEKDDQ